MKPFILVTELKTRGRTSRFSIPTEDIRWISRRDGEPTVVVMKDAWRLSWSEVIRVKESPDELAQMIRQAQQGWLP